MPCHTTACALSRFLVMLSGLFSGLTLGLMGLDVAWWQSPPMNGLWYVNARLVGMVMEEGSCDGGFPVNSGMVDVGLIRLPLLIEVD